MTFASDRSFITNETQELGLLGSITQPTDRSISHRFNIEKINDFRPWDKAAMNSGPTLIPGVGQSRSSSTVGTLGPHQYPAPTCQTDKIDVEG